jgi:hypothetical protein
MSGGFSRFIGLAGAALIVAVATGSARAQDVAVEISGPDISSLSASCASGPACNLALKALIAKVMAANPGQTFERALASVVASISAGYNAGVVPAAIARTIFNGATKEASIQGLTSLSRSISIATNEVDRGDPIELEAVAEASASPT